MKIFWTWLKLSDSNIIANLSIWLILLTPLILYVYVYQPFSFGRYIIFIFVTTGLLLGLLFSRTIKFYYQWWRQPIFWITLIWLIVAIISASIGVNPFRSWWGTVSRSTGMFLFLALWIMGWSLLMLINRREGWLKIFSIMSWVGCISSIYAILQILKIPGVYIMSYGTRASALIGNPIFFAQLLLFTIFLTLYFLFGSSGKIKWGYLLSLLLQLIAIILTASRGPLLALGMAGLIWFIGWLLILKPRVKFTWRIWTYGGIVSALLVTIIYFLLPKTSLDRLLNIFNSSLSARLITWQTAWQAIQARPVLGYGNENGWYAFTHFYKPGLADISFGETIVDRAHNFVLDQLLVNGWVGLVVLLTLLGYLIWSLWCYVRKSIEQNNSTEALLGWSLLVIVLAYFLANLTAFDTITVMIYGVVILSGVIVIVSKNLANPVKLQLAWIWQTLTFLLVIGLVLFDFKYLVPAIRIGQSVGLADNAAKHNNFRIAASAYAKAQGIINPYRWLSLTNYPNFARVYSTQLLSDKNVSWADSMAVDGLRVLNSIEKEEPDRVAILLEKPILLTILSISDKQYVNKVQEAFDNLVKTFPNHEYIYLNWARALLGVGKYAEARQILNQLESKFKVLPIEFEFWRAVTDIQLKSRDQKYVITDLQTTISRGMNFADGYQEVLKIVASYLVNLNQWDSAKYYQEKIVNLLPNSVDEHINLAAIYKELKIYDKATEQARIVVKLDPTKTEATKQFLQTIGQTL